MKKLILFFLFAALALSMLSCSNNSEDKSDDDSSNEDTTDEQQNDSFVLKAIVKGKTNEGMDATGEGIGIAVHAVALVKSSES